MCKAGERVMVKCPGKNGQVFECGYKNTLINISLKEISREWGRDVGRRE